MKRLYAVVAVVVCCFSIFSICLLSNDKYTVANATTNYYDVSKYVDSDFLLKSDGTPSYKKVQDFSEEVKNAMYGTCFDELDEVIPAQYLNTTEKTLFSNTMVRNMDFMLLKRVIDSTFY